MIKITQTLLQALRNLEGLPGGRPALVAYRDIAGVWTNGYGHTEGVTGISPTITTQQAEADLLREAQRFAAGVDSLVTVPLNDNQRDALILFAFNNGLGAFASSTLLKVLNAGDYAAVPAQMMRWVYFTNPTTKKKEPSNGLSARRAAEVSLWLRPPNGAVTVEAPSVTLTDGTEGVSVVATPPPTKVTQTRTGKFQIGALVTGGTASIVQGYQQAAPTIQAVQAAADMTASLPQWLKLFSVVCVIACMAFAAYTLWHKHNDNKESTP